MRKHRAFRGLAGAKRSNIPTSMDQIKRRNAACGHHYFSPGTMRYFGSRVGSRVFVGSNAAYFVTSEHTGFSRSGRAYTIRKTKDGCAIDTAGKGFLAYKTKAQAETDAKRLAASGRTLPLPRRRSRKK